MAGLFICFCSSIWFISGIQSQSMITTISQRSISTSVPTLLKISSTVVQPVISSVDNANSSRNSTDGFINKPNVSLGEISRTVVKPDPSSPLNPQVSRSAQAPTSGNVTTPILNTTVSTGGGSTTFPTKLSTQQIATTTLFTRRTTTGPQGTDIPIDSPCRPFYSKTNLPQDSIDMAHFQMHPFYPLVYTYCSVNLLLLICSVHLPVFDIVSSKILPPCSDLCDQVSMDCSYAIRKLKFPISTLLQQCSSKSTPGNTTNTKCFLPKATPERKGPNVSCCFDVKPQPFCNTSTFVQSSLNRSQQDEVIFNLSTMYLPIFHALESLNQPVCAARLSDYLCLKKFQYCVPGSKNGGCSGEIYKPFRENCLFFADNSSPCSIHHINTILQKAGYNIQIMTTDFDCSTLQSITSEAEELSQNILRFTNDRRITNGLRIPRLTNVVKPRGSERTVHWDSLRDTKEIKEYGILWRKREGPDSSKNNYQHNHTTKEYYKFNGIPTLNSQYEVLLTAIGQDGIPQPFTTVELPLTNDYCPSEEVGSLEAYGIFQWPETAIGIRATIACPYNNDSIASRDCLSTNQTESGGVWGPSLVTDCKYMEQRSGNLFLLSQREVNSSNVVNITKEVKEWSSTNQNNTLNPGDIDYIATILNSIALVKEKANEVLDDFLTIIDNVLDAQLKNIVESQQNRNSSSRIVETLNTFAESLVIGPESELQAVKKNFDISLQTVKPQNFSGLNFSGIISKTNQSQTRNNTSKIQSNEVTQVLSPSLIIPRTIFNESTEKNRSANQTVIFVLYRETKFFILSLADTTRRSSRLNSLVISGSIEGLSVSNLSVPVNIALPSIERGETKSILCSYWDFSIGNWSQDGCKFERVLEDGRVLCSCDHFTNFAMLMDIAPGEKTAHDKILGVISYIGCALSLAGLILTIFTILILRDLRTQIPSQILLNFCIALSVTLIVFIAAVEKTRTSSLAGCRAAAIALHYFLLAALFWMAVEAYNMYWAFVKVFSAPSRAKLLIKCCVFAWGTPAVVVGITMVVALDKYGDGTYCRLQGVPFIVAFLTPTVLIIVGNIVAFCFIIRSLLTSGAKVTSDKKTTGYQQARQGIAIMVLLGLTWLFGILAIGDAKLVFQYLFCIFNSLQGMLVFIFFVVLPTGTRRKLQKLRKRMTYSNNRNCGNDNRSDFQLKNLADDSSQLNKNVYSNTGDIPTLTSGAAESKYQNPTFDHQAFENHVKNVSDEEEDMDRVYEILDQKFDNELWSNPNVTRYSVRKNGTTYVTTIELNIK